jgi:hypothetical protein
MCRFELSTSSGRTAHETELTPQDRPMTVEASIHRRKQLYKQSTDEEEKILSFQKYQIR